MADHPRRLRAEALLLRPGLIGAQGRLRDDVLELRSEAEAALADADGRLRQAAADRLAAAERIRACNRALLGTGTVQTDDGGTILVVPRPSGAFDDPPPDPSGLRLLRGRELREAVLDALRILARPATIAELRRVLAAHGCAPAGRASQTISNALRIAVRDGLVARTARGQYELEPVRALSRGVT
jgi:hypothetical protein